MNRRYRRDPKLQTGKRRRRAKILRTGARAGRRTLGARVKSTFVRDTERREAIRQQAFIRSAEDTAATLGNMKGVVMKLGQMASFVAQALPEDIRAPLTALQQDAPPMTWDLARTQIREELGAEPESIFAEIEHEPAAAASIGQVHRGCLDDGTSVAIKVQYPGVDAAILSDLENAGLITMFVSRMLPGLDMDAFVDEFRTHITQELDYTIEAKNQLEFAEFWADDDVITIPRVFTELSTRRVLTSEWHDGARFSEVWDVDQSERNRVGETIYRYAQMCMAQLHAFNGDPHPGNYKFRSDGRIVFLDFGLVKRLPVDAARRQAAIVQAMRSRDPEVARSTFVDIGEVEPDAVDADDLYAFMQPLFEAILHDTEYRWNPEDRRELMLRLVERDGEFADVRSNLQLPPDAFFMLRLNAGLGAILSRLEAESNWYRIYDDCWSHI